MGVQKVKTPAGASSIRYKTIPPKGGGGVCPPGTVDFTATDTIDMSDALAGTLGPFNAPDTFDVADLFAAPSGVVDDSIAVADAMGDLSGIAAPDTVTLADARNAGTITTLQADTFDVADLFAESVLAVDDSVDFADARTQDTTTAQTGDSFDVADARTAGTISTTQADTLDFADILRGIESAAADSVNIVDAAQTAALSDGNVWAGTVVLATNWDSSANAVDTDEATFATQSVASSGIGGITNVNEAGDLVLSFPDITASMSAFTWTSVVLHDRWRTRSTGTQITAGTVSYTVRYSLDDGGGYTDIETISAPVSDPGAQTLDLTGIADTLAEIQQFRFRMDGTIGSGTGLSKTQLIDCFFARLVLVGTRTF